MGITPIIAAAVGGAALGAGTSSLMGSGGSSDGGAGSNITAIGNQVQQQAAMSPQETSQYTGSFDVGKYLQSLYGQNLGAPGASVPTTSVEQQYQNQGPLAQQLYQSTLAQAKDPTAGWQSTLQPQLAQAQDQINSYYNSRGLLNSGLPIGAMGQAGVDLAIQNAQNEMAYQQQSLQNANALSTNAAGLGQQNIQNLQGIYGQQQNVGLTAEQNAQQGFQVGAGYQAYPQQARLGSYYGGIAAQQALPGQLIGAGGQLGAAYIKGM